MSIFLRIGYAENGAADRLTFKQAQKLGVFCVGCQNERRTVHHLTPIGSVTMFVVGQI
jgi:hypothetical protein